MKNKTHHPHRPAMPIRVSRHKHQSSSTLDDLEDLPGPSTGIADNGIRVTDICLLKRSDEHGTQAAVSSPSGYYWVDLRELQRVAPDIWQAYDKWYSRVHKRHPLSDLLPSGDSTSESESDEPKATWTLPKTGPTLRKIRSLAQLMAVKSMEFKDLFLAAGASSQTAVGLFIRMKKTLIKWRTIFLSQIDPLKMIRSISHARVKQLAMGLHAWKRSFTAAHMESHQYESMSRFSLVRWLTHWRSNFKIDGNRSMAEAKSTTYILGNKLNHWYQWLIEHNSRLVRKFWICNHLMMIKHRKFLTYWRVSTKAFNSNVRNPLRSSLRYWLLSSSLSARLRLHDKWRMRVAFNQFRLKDYVAVCLHRERNYLATWRQVSVLYATDLVLTNLAFNHCNHSLLAHAWHQWSLIAEQVKIANSLVNRASLHWKWLCFERWQEVLTRQKASLKLLIAADNHCQLTASSEALLSWYDTTMVLAKDADDLRSGSLHEQTVALYNSWFNWLNLLLSAKNCRTATSHYDMTNRCRSFHDLKEHCKGYYSRLHLFEPHLEINHPAVYSKLVSISPITIWSTELIAKTHSFNQLLPLIKSLWQQWKKNCRPVDFNYVRLTRHWPTSILQWLDTRSMARFMGMLTNRCSYMNVDVPQERQAKAKAIINALSFKRVAGYVKQCFSALRTSSPDSDGSNLESDSNCSDDGDLGDDECLQSLRPVVSRAWKALRNITASSHGTDLPMPHVAAPVYTWDYRLSSSVSTMKEFSKLKYAGSSLNQSVLQRIPTIGAKEGKLLKNPFRLWSTHLDQNEYDSADRCEIIASYTFVWCLPLWIDIQDGTRSVILWDCCLNRYTSIPVEACLPDQEADQVLEDQFLTFQGISFAEPRNSLNNVKDLGTPLTVRGCTLAEAVSVSHAASPLSAPRITKLAQNEDASDAELLKLANREHAALLRSPFASTEKNQAGLPESKHVAGSNTTSTPTIGQVAVLQTVRKTNSATVGTVHAVDKNNRILVRWDNDSSLSEVSLSDLTLIDNQPAPASTTMPTPSSNPSHVADVVPADIPRCYNPSCGKAYEGAEQKCTDCNFPRDRTSFFGACGHLTDPAKKWCQHPGCSAVNTHFLSIEQQAQLQALRGSAGTNSSTSDERLKLFKDRHSSLRSKLTFIDADLKVFLLLRAGQTDSSLKYERTMTAPDYLCTLIDTEVGTLQRKADNINQFRIVHTWRLYYNTCNVRIGGSTSFGLHAIEFDRYVADETSSSKLIVFDFSGAVSLDHSPKESTKYKNIEHWDLCHTSMNDWIGYHLQKVLESEFQAAVAYIKAQYLDTIVENLDIDVAFCEEVICVLHKDFSSELRLFVTNKGQHLVRYPDTIWVFEGHQFVRPKFWIVHNGVERSSFSRHFREMKELRRTQKLNTLSAELSQVKQTLASGGKPKKKNGGNDSTPDSWSDLPRPVKLPDDVITSFDHFAAAEQFKTLCHSVDNGKHADAVGLCWRNSTRVGCNRKSCKQSHEKQIPKAVAKKWTIGHLICAAYGGFKSMPVSHKPDDVSSVVIALKKKLELDELKEGNYRRQAGRSVNAAPAENSDPPAYLEPPSCSEQAEPSSQEKPGSTFQITPMGEPVAPVVDEPMAMGDVTKSLLVVRPIIRSSEWLPSTQKLNVEGDLLEIKQSRYWSITFPGRLGSDEITLFSTEKDLGQHLAGERNRCMILTEGASSGRAPTQLLDNYRLDSKLLRDRLPDGTNSLIKIHLDLFQMNVDGPMPDNAEIAADLLVRSQPLSYHHSQILEQETENNKVKVLIDVSKSCESDKIQRTVLHFICLVGSKASPDSPVSFRKIELGHATWLDNVSYCIGGGPRVPFHTLADFIHFSKPIEPICRFSFKPCVPLAVTLSDFDGLTWPDFLPPSQLGGPQHFDLDYSTVGDYLPSADPVSPNPLLIKFRHATDLRNPNRISMEEFGYYMADEVEHLTALALNYNWAQMDLLHFDWYCFPVDDTRRKIYAIWELDAKELESNEQFITNYTKVSELVLKSWGFQPDGSKFGQESSASGLCGRWNGNAMRLYKMARSAWLLNQHQVLLAAQRTAWSVAPSGVITAHGFDLSHLWNFALPEPALLVDKFGGESIASLDQRLVYYAGRYKQQLDIASQDVSSYSENKHWFGEMATIMTELVKTVDSRFECAHLKMLTRYTRLFTPDASGPAADANRIQRTLIDNPTVQLESVLGRRLLEAHRFGVSAEMECTRLFRESVSNPVENEQFADLICKASRKLIVKGMKLFFPEECIDIISKWEGILLSPNLIVFTDKKPEGRICQAMSANPGDSPNNLMLNHNLLPCAYDHALEATRAIYDMKEELDAACKMVPGWESDQQLMLMLFRSLAYVDDFHVVGHDTDSLLGGGTDLKQAFNHTNLAESAVGLIAANLEVPADWAPFMSKHCIVVWQVLNFGWIHSPANHQPVPLAVRNAVNNTCARDIISSLPGYDFHPTDLSHLALEALFRYIRYTEGYTETIDFEKTQDVENKLHRLGCTMYLDTLEIAVKPHHLARALEAIQAGDVFEDNGLAGVPLSWLQETLGQFRFAAVMPKSWIMGFIVPLMRCLKGVKSDAAPSTLCYPSLPFQSDDVSLANLHRCRRALAVILKAMVTNPQCARLPMYLLLPPTEVVQRAPTDRILFCGHDACDNALATLVWQPDSEGVIEVLVVEWSPEIRRLLLNSRHSDRRQHHMDFLCMGNLEHSCLIANMLQFGTHYNHMLVLQISDNQPTVGVTNKNYGRNFVDQEMCRLASLMKVTNGFVQTAIWVETWLNDLLDGLSRLYVDGVLQDTVMQSVTDISNRLGISLKFMDPNEKVKSFLAWLESDKTTQMSLVDIMEAQILNDVSSTNINLQNLTTEKIGAASDFPRLNILPSLVSSACSLSVHQIAAATTDLIRSISPAFGPLTAAHICCGFGGMTIGSILAGFLPVLNVENNPAAILFHELLTAGLICCGDLDNLNCASLPRVHNLTVGWPCPPHTCLGRRKGWNDKRCRVKQVVALILAMKPYTVFGECVPGLLTSMNGEVFKFIIDQLSEHYHIHYAVVKFAHFGHLSNRRRLVMAMLLKSIFTEPDFDDFPSGHVECLSTAKPVNDCLIPTSDVPESFYVSGSYTPLPVNNSDPTGRLVFTHSMDNIHGAGSPRCPSAVFDSRGLAPTGLATVFANEEEFGVNAGLVFRKSSDGSVMNCPSRLTAQEIVNIGNFPYDTVEAANAIGITNNQVSSGVNNAVPPSVCFPIACWFRDKLDQALLTRNIKQANRNLLHCGVNTVHSWLSGRASHTKHGGVHESPATTPSQPPAHMLLTSTLSDGSTVLEKVLQRLLVDIGDVQVRASYFIDIIIDALGVQPLAPVIAAGNALADHAEAHKSFDIGTCEEIIRTNMMMQPSKEECRLILASVNQMLTQLMVSRRRQVTSLVNCTCNWTGKTIVSCQTLLDALDNSQGTERSTDEEVDGIPADQVSYLHRVTNGSLGLESDIQSDRRAGAGPESFMFGDFAILGTNVDMHILAECGIEVLADSDHSGASADLGSDELSDDEPEAISELHELQLSMRAAARREDFTLAASLQSRIQQMRRGLVKLAEKRGVSKANVRLMQSHQRMKQRSIKHTLLDTLPLVLVSADNCVLAKVTNTSTSLPRLVPLEADTKRSWYHSSLHTVHGLHLTALQIQKVVGASITFSLVTVQEQSDVYSAKWLSEAPDAYWHDWLTQGKITTCLLPAYDRACVEAAFDLGALTQTATNSKDRDMAMEQHRLMAQSSYHSYEHPAFNTVAAKAATTLHHCLVAASMAISAELINVRHKLVEWQINWRLAQVSKALVALTLENTRLSSATTARSMSPSSPITLSAYPATLRDAAITAVKENVLSPGEVAILPTDLKVELAYELSLVSDAPLTARFKVEHWLLHPEEAEAAGNDWVVAADCDLLTSQVIDAWSSLPDGASFPYHSMSDGSHSRKTQRELYLDSLQVPDISNSSLPQIPTSPHPGPLGGLSTSLALSEASNPFSTIFEMDAVTEEVFPQIAYLFQAIPTDNYLSSLSSAELSGQALGDYSVYIAASNHMYTRRLYVNMIRCDHLLQSRMSLAMITTRISSVCGSWHSAFSCFLHSRPMSLRLSHLLRTGSNYLLPLYDRVVQDSNAILKRLLHRWLSSCATLTEQVKSIPGSAGAHSGALLTYLLSDEDLAHVLLDCLLDWPPLLSRRTLVTSSNLHSICVQIAQLHASWSRDTRLSRLLVWKNCSTASAKLHRSRLVIDDCRTSMVALAVHTTRHLATQYASICRLSARATEASVMGSTARRRIIRMCHAGDLLSPVLLSRLIYIRAQGLIADWFRNASHRPINTSMLVNCLAILDMRTPDIKPLLTHWLAQAYDMQGAPPRIQPAVTYLAEERQVLRTFFKDRIGASHIHMYLASTGGVSLPGGNFNPCEKRHRRSDFRQCLPIKQKVGLDVAVGQLSKLLPDRPELGHIQICSRSQLAVRLARSTLKGIAHQATPARKYGGWDDLPTSSILFRPPHPSKQNKRVALVGPPTQEELDAEKEFEAACMGASLGGSTEKKYRSYVEQFTEYCLRCEADLIVESDATADHAIILKDLRFWVRRFLLSEGGVRGLQYSSINGKAYALRWHFLTTYGVDVLSGWVEHKIFMRGLKRVRHTPKRKIPVSWALLVWIVRQLTSSPRDLVVKAAVLVGWWFLCRISEIVAFRLGSVRFFDRSGCQLNIQADDLSEAVEVDMLFAVTKNDVDGDGAMRTHSRVQSDICVVSALTDMVTARRSAVGSIGELDLMAPLFLFFDNSPDSTTERSVTRATVVRVLKAAASAADIPQVRVSCHSLRSGGAVAMLSVSGCSYADVRLFGRWRSDCARIYMRAVRGMMADVSARMAANSTDSTVMMAGGSRQKRY